jgi:hypothetical protein
MKDFLSGARKMVLPREDEALFAGSSSSGSRWTELLSHIESKGSRQHRRAVLEVCHNILTQILLLTDYISYDLCNFARWLKVS